MKPGLQPVLSVVEVFSMTNDQVYKILPYHKTVISKLHTFCYHNAADLSSFRNEGSEVNSKEKQQLKIIPYAKLRVQEY